MVYETGTCTEKSYFNFSITAQKNKISETLRYYEKAFYSINIKIYGRVLNRLTLSN